MNMRDFHKYLIPCVIIVLGLGACSKDVKREEQVFFTDFEQALTVYTENLQLNTFNGSTVAGFYNAGDLLVELQDLPSHDMAVIEFDLYVHDTWDGNYQDKNGNADLWKFAVDGKLYINTTFSNAYCPPGQHCPPQSYPMNYPNNSNFPRTGARAMLPGVCIAANDLEGTAWYKISKTIEHSDRIMRLSFKDELSLLNDSKALCDESWSIDNLRIRLITL